MPALRPMLNVKSFILLCACSLYVGHAENIALGQSTRQKTADDVRPWDIAEHGAAGLHVSCAKGEDGKQYLSLQKSGVPFLRNEETSS